jgi:hypothetical protein
MYVLDYLILLAIDVTDPVFKLTQLRYNTNSHLEI